MDKPPAPPPSGADKRRFLRYPVIVLKVSEEDGRQPLFGYARNISRGGMFIESINPRQPGEHYSISFSVPDTDIEVKCRCEVVWARPYNRKLKLQAGYGIRFLDLPEATARRIEAWIAKQAGG
jgi:uncharacterized protein (TIGR02266 family)